MNNHRMYSPADTPAQVEVMHEVVVLFYRAPDGQTLELHDGGVKKDKYSYSWF